MGVLKNWCLQVDGASSRLIIERRDFQKLPSISGNTPASIPFSQQLLFARKYLDGTDLVIRSEPGQAHESRSNHNIKVNLEAPLLHLYYNFGIAIVGLCGRFRKAKLSRNRFCPPPKHSWGRLGSASLFLGCCSFCVRLQFRRYCLL